jgi:cell shape-determining protein MreC
MLLILLTLTGFVLLLAPERMTNRLQGTFTRIFRLPLRVGRSVSLSARVQNQRPGNLQKNQPEHENHIYNLTALLEEKQNTIEMLSGMRNRFYALEGAGLVVADVITAVMDSSCNELIVNRGSEDHIAAGQFVLIENCVIGVVSSVMPRQCRIRLITDAASRLAVQIKGIDSRLWMFGTGAGKARIQWARRRVPIGTLVLAQKLPGRLDAPMIVGKITACAPNKDSPLLWDLTVKPNCRFKAIKTVTILVMNPTKD